MEFFFVIYLGFVIFVKIIVVLVESIHEVLLVVVLVSKSLVLCVVPMVVHLGWVSPVGCKVGGFGSYFQVLGVRILVLNL